MDSEKISFWISVKYRLTAVTRARYTTSRVHSAVTLGLPSRSPPIHDEKRMIEWSKGIRGKPWFCSAVSMRLQNCGYPAKMVSLKYDKPARISSCGFGGLRRISSVRHAA